MAMATCFFAAGALCPHAEGGVGALATQALINPTYGPRGLQLLREGIPARDCARYPDRSDEGRATRQLHLQDVNGQIAAYTGAECIAWCGHSAHQGFSVAGNMLTGPEVIAATARAYEAASSLPFPRRLISALKPAKRPAATSAASNRPRSDLYERRISGTRSARGRSWRSTRRARAPRSRESRAVRPFRQVLPARRDAGRRIRPRVIEADIARATAESGR